MSAPDIDITVSPQHEDHCRYRACWPDGETLLAQVPEAFLDLVGFMLAARTGLRGRAHPHRSPGRGGCTPSRSPIEGKWCSSEEVAFRSRWKRLALNRALSQGRSMTLSRLRFPRVSLRCRHQPSKVRKGWAQPQSLRCLACVPSLSCRTGRPSSAVIIHGRPWSIIAHALAAGTSRSSTTPSAATSLSMSRLYVAQRIRGGLSGYSSSAGSPPSLRRSLRAGRRAPSYLVSR